MNFQRLACLAILLLCIASFSCKKSTLLGYNVLPGSDDIGGTFTDTFSLKTTVIRDDSIPTSSLSYNVLGNMFDPVVGKTYASIFTEFDLPTNDITFADTNLIYIDSVVLALGYKGSYGYIDVPQSLRVYELGESLSPLPDAGYYYSNKSFLSVVQLGSKINFVPNMNDSVIVTGIKRPPQLRIRLRKEFGQRFLDASGDSALSNVTSFHDFFHGLCIQPDTIATPYGGGLMYIDLLSSTSGLFLYYHTPTTDSSLFRFPITDNVVKTNFYKHNYNNTLVSTYLNNDSTVNDTVVFVQALAGVKTKITIPNIQNLKNVLINKAELVFTQIYDPNNTDSVFIAPANLVCAKSDSIGKDIQIPDALVSFPNAGGVASSYMNSQGQKVLQYKFSITQQLQLIVDDKTADYGLYLIVYRRGEVGSRIEAAGANKIDDVKMKLNLIYTNIQ